MNLIYKWFMKPQLVFDQQDLRYNPSPKLSMPLQNLLVVQKVSDGSPRCLATTADRRHISSAWRDARDVTRPRPAPDIYGVHFIYIAYRPALDKHVFCHALPIRLETTNGGEGNIDFWTMCPRVTITLLSTETRSRKFQWIRVTNM